MKKCPQCNRTYADDGFTFCLEDGALLSAPYDANKSAKPVSTIESPGPPPTAVLPASETGGQELPPTGMSKPSPSSERSNPTSHARTESPRRPKSLKYIVGGLVTLVVAIGAIGFLGLYVAGTSNCPKLVINCYPSDTSTYCDLAEDKSSHTFKKIDDKPISGALGSRSVILLQAAALPEGITNVSWSASSGTIQTNHSQLTIDTSGLTGKTIEVKAKVTNSSWFCSTTVSTSFVVPAGFGTKK